MTAAFVSETATPSAPRPRHFRIYSAAEIQSLPAPEWLIKGVLPAGGCGEIHGQPEAAKTFLALSIGFHVERGLEWFGREVKPGPVLYVAAEGSSGLSARLGAWATYENIIEQAGVYFMTEPVNLLDSVDVLKLLNSLAGIGIQPVLIVFDTLARCIPGGDENSARDVGLAISNIDSIRRETGAAVLVIHHTRKDGESERGSTALRGAMDVMIEMKRTDDLITVNCVKMKDAESFKSLQLQLTPWEGSCGRHTASHAWRRGSPLWRRGAARTPDSVALGQRQRVHGTRHGLPSRESESAACDDARVQSAVERNVRSLRQHAAAGLYAGADLSSAEAVLEQLPNWIVDYNVEAPHSALGYQSPAAYRQARSHTGST